MSMTDNHTLYYPPDLDEAYNTWQASCGPCALASILGRSVNSVKALLEGIEQRVYCNVTHLKAGLDQAGVQYRSVGPRRPTRGLMFIQLGGYEDKPVHVQYRKTHWISIAGETVFDVNAPTLVSFTEWDRVFPRLMQESGCGNGTYWIRTGLEVL